MGNNPRRFSEHEVAKQKAAVLRGRMLGSSFTGIAAALSEDTADGRPIDEATVRRRYKAAIDEYKVPRAEWDSYRNRQLAEIEAAKDEVMTAILQWSRLDDTKDLVQPIAALVKLQERADRVIGFPESAPPPPPANAGALDYVRTIVSNQAAHKALLASMRTIETEILNTVEIEDE